MSTRTKQIEEAADQCDRLENKLRYAGTLSYVSGFTRGAHWSDANPVVRVPEDLRGKKFRSVTILESAPSRDDERDAEAYGKREGAVIPYIEHLDFNRTLMKAFLAGRKGMVRAGCPSCKGFLPWEAPYGNSCRCIVTESESARRTSEAVAQAVKEVEAKHEAEAYAVQLKWQKSAYHDVCGFLKRVFGDRADPFVNSIRMHFLLSGEKGGV